MAISVTNICYFQHPSPTVKYCRWKFLNFASEKNQFLTNFRIFSQTNLSYLLHMHLTLKNSHFPVILNFEQIWILNSNQLHFDLDYQKVRNVSSSKNWWIEWILMVFETFLKHSNGLRSEKPPRFEPPHLFQIYLWDILVWPAISINTKKFKNIYFSRFMNLCMSQKGFQTDESWDGRFLIKRDLK